MLVLFIYIAFALNLKQHRAQRNSYKRNNSSIIVLIWLWFHAMLFILFQNIDRCVSDPPKLLHFGRIRHGCGNIVSMFREPGGYLPLPTTDSELFHEETLSESIDKYCWSLCMKFTDLVATMVCLSIHHICSAVLNLTGRLP